MADDIRIFLPGIGDVEHSLRANLRTFHPFCEFVELFAGIFGTTFYIDC